jgi:hypothetical protein
MKNNLLAIILTAALTVITSLPNSVESQTTESVPKSIAQPQLNDRRLPIAKINPNKPIQIRVMNSSKGDIQIALAEPASEEVTVKPEKFVTFGRLNKSFLPLPINLTIYTNVKNTNLNAAIRVENNELIVTITSKTNVFGASREVNVNKKGNIFLY